MIRPDTGSHTEADAGRYEWAVYGAADDDRPTRAELDAEEANR